MKETRQNDDATIARLLKTVRRIALVGASNQPSRESHAIGRYLIEAGFEVIPVNPQYDTVFSTRCYPTLADVPGQIDLVSVFRRPEFCAEIAQQATDAGARAIWLQSGITNHDARRIATEAGMDYIEDRCIMVEHGGRHLE